MSDKIKHVVLLMFENSSFDRYLGCFQEIYPGKLSGIDPGSPRSCQDKDGSRFFQKPTTQFQMPLDPRHEHANVMEQLKDGNTGFVRDFSQAYPDSTSSDRQLIMSYYPLDFLPALHKLAREFTICDHWFSSLPGPTWPNRFFALSGSSNGLVVMPAGPLTTRMLLEETQPTVFSRLTEAKRSWKIYYNDVPSSLVLHQQLTDEARANYFEFPQFFQDCQGPSEKFPDFVFIEPKYYGLDQNDDHPPHHVMKAQKLMADVYNAIRKNQDLWESTLLVINYDEHGGFFDHVVPEAADPPRYPVATDEYQFDLLGVRVPALLISPWVEKNVINTIFDHTSLLKYLQEKWGLGDLGDRVRSAKSIGGALGKVDKARKDTVQRIDVDLTKWPSNTQLEAKPSGHNYALDVALAVIQDDAGIEVMTVFSDFARTGRLPERWWRWNFWRILWRMVREFIRLKPEKCDSKHDLKVAKLKQSLKRYK